VTSLAQRDWQRNDLEATNIVAARVHEANLALRYIAHSINCEGGGCTNREGCWQGDETEPACQHFRQSRRIRFLRALLEALKQDGRKKRRRG